MITSVDRDDLADGGAEHFAATIRAIRARAPADDHRGADARFPAQGRRAGDGDGGAARRVQPQSRNRAVALSDDPARRALFRTRCGCCSARRSWTRRCSPSRASWSGLAKARGDHAGDGRPALRRRRFPHHRPISCSPRESTPPSNASWRPTNSTAYKSIAIPKAF